MYRTAPSQKTMLHPPGCAELANGNEPSTVRRWPKLMFSNVPAWLARDHPLPSAALGPYPGRSCPARQSVFDRLVRQTSSEPTNIAKFGSGHAQFVSRPPECGVPVEAPASVFSAMSKVFEAPSTR